jgi:hypothetical protein
VSKFDHKAWSVSPEHPWISLRISVAINVHCNECLDICKFIALSHQKYACMAGAYTSPVMIKKNAPAEAGKEHLLTSAVELTRQGL